MDDVQSQKSKDASNDSDASSSFMVNTSDIVLKDLFHVAGAGYDVVLTERLMTWKSLSDRARHRVKSRGFSTKKNNHPLDESDTNCSETNGSGSRSCIFLKNVIGASILYEKRASHLKTQGPCMGLAVHEFRKVDAVHYVDDVTEFCNPSLEICTRWCITIQRILAKQNECRPLSLKIFIQPFAGKKQSRLVFGQRVAPLFTAAGISQDVEEIGDSPASIERACQELDLKTYDSIVCVGGDGSVGQILTALLNGVQSAAEKSASGDFKPEKLPVPFGIIPTGLVNQIAYSVLGTDDPVTAAIHIVLGHRQSVDICSVWQNDELRLWSFFAHFGFFSSLLSHGNKYFMLGEKRLEAGVVHMLTNNKFSCLDCKIEYVQCETDSSDTELCREGCTACKSVAKGVQSNGAEVREGLATFTDVVRPFQDSTDNISEDSASTAADEVPAVDSTKIYKSVEDRFSNVSIYSIPALCSLAPLGMSKFSHQSDGCLDLVLLSNVPRKEFVRYLRRLGNTKNELELPFVHHYRCKELRFHLRSFQLWNGSDMDKNSGDGGAVAVDAQTTRSATPPSVAEGSEDQAGETETTVVADGKSDEVDEEEIAANGDRTTDTHLNFQVDSEAGTRDTSNPRRRRSSLAERLHLDKLFTRIRRSSIKNITKNTKMETSNVIWNINNEICDATDLRFVVHSGLLLLHGVAIPRDYRPADVKMPCLAIF